MRINMQKKINAVTVGRVTHTHTHTQSPYVNKNEIDNCILLENVVTLDSFKNHVI